MGMHIRQGRWSEGYTRRGHWIRGHNPTWEVWETLAGTIGDVVLVGPGRYLPICLFTEDAPLVEKSTLGEAAESIYRRWEERRV